MKVKFEEILNIVKTAIGGKNTLFTDRSDVYYLTRINSASINVMFIDDRWYLLTTKKYLDKATRKVEWMEVVDVSDPDWLKGINVTNYFSEINIDSDGIAPREFEKIRKPFDDHSIEVIKSEYKPFREVYHKNDIEFIKESISIAERITRNTLARISVGMTEEEVERIVFAETAKTDGEGFAFHTIVTSGPNTGSPVLMPSHRSIQANELLTLVVAIQYRGFASDVARTVVISGKPSDEANKAHKVLDKALKAVLKLVKAGAIPDDLFEEYIKVLNKGKFDREHTVNSIGHPIGVEVHDGPSFGPGNVTPLKEGEVINIEPVIFVSGEYGIRIQQTLLVTETGYDLLTKMPTSFVVEKI